MQTWVLLIFKIILMNIFGIARSFIEILTTCWICISPTEFETQDQLEYTWFPAGSSGVVFRVKAANDAHIAFSSTEAEADPMLEVFIGGWKNTKSVIRKNRTKPDFAEVDTPAFLTSDEFRGFWIRWTDGYLNVGKEGEAAPFLTYEITDTFPINFVGVCTGW